MVLVGGTMATAENLGFLWGDDDDGDGDGGRRHVGRSLARYEGDWDL